MTTLNVQDGLLTLTFPGIRLRDREVGAGFGELLVSAPEAAELASELDVLARP